ncbi:hypothetical protein [Salimicrobium album]|uniref:YqzL-like protein n=1 Tax=Salimicrobium album TaxID=50717 RepID=A0A1H3D9T5_9BACI|nr:hypothetical protein [Salimicrobium album]SDX63060.1 hypothetical protein SAMN04488081_0880 [Salimicrobium album]
MYYNFLLDRWKRKKTDKKRLQSYVPFFISQSEYEKIVSTPQE